MPIYEDFVGARAISPERSGIIQLSRLINHHVGTTPLVITRPGDERILTIRCEAGTIRVRPDDYTTRTFEPADVNTGTDEATLTAHGLVTGQGPFQILQQGAVMAPGTSLTINASQDRYDRAAGSWPSDGFEAGMSIITAGTASNNAVYTVTSRTGLALYIAEDITVGEGPSTLFSVNQVTTPPGGLDLLTDYWVIVVDADTIKFATSQANALANAAIPLSAQGVATHNLGGSVGWATTSPPTASKTDGYGSLAVTSGNELVLSAPERITLVGMAAADCCTYWWSK